MLVPCSSMHCSRQQIHTIVLLVTKKYCTVVQRYVMLQCSTTHSASIVPLHSCTNIYTSTAQADAQPATHAYRHTGDINTVAMRLLPLRADQPYCDQKIPLPPMWFSAHPACMTLQESPQHPHVCLPACLQCQGAPCQPHSCRQCNKRQLLQ
jgi:hypothetical protein